ncbi:MAG TPA: hypothetical protein PK122_06035 [Candidatus Paceibacterota bacterium]|nr:hypothetical protein [Candidatus Paceibacterota bacterium]
MKTQDFILNYENGLADCGLEPHNIDYDKLSNHRQKYANQLAEMLEQAKNEGIREVLDKTSKSVCYDENGEGEDTFYHLSVSAYDKFIEDIF